MERNIQLQIAYEGTFFHGFQVQSKQRTVQGELEKALETITGVSTKLFASGRTDAGVHAKKQICHFLTNSSVPIARWPIALNSILSNDVVVLSAKEMPTLFHARYGVKKKTYRYIIYHDKYIDVFRRNFSWHYPYPLDVDAMVDASKVFVGEHDFTSFSSAKANVKNKVRTIYHFSVWKEGQEIYFEITGNGFLYNMVRIIVGTLVEVGRGRMTQDDILLLFEKKNRTKAGLTAPSQGLILWDVQY